MRELNASDDKAHFDFDSGPQGMWPVYKGESFDIWNPETGVVYAYADPTEITAVLQARRLNQIRIRRSALYGRSREWAEDPSTLPARQARIAWRDSSRATDSRTVRVALVPPPNVLVHQAYTLFWREGGPREEAYALGVLSSINAAPVPARDPHDDLQRRIEVIAGSLAAVDDRYAVWADAVAVPVGGLKGEARETAICDLDALVAHLYGLGDSDVRVIFETFHEGWDYRPRLAATLDAMARVAGART